MFGVHRGALHVFNCKQGGRIAGFGGSSGLLWVLISCDNPLLGSLVQSIGGSITPHSFRELYPSIHPSHPIPSNPIPSNPIPSHPIPSIHPSLDPSTHLPIYLAIYRSIDLSISLTHQASEFKLSSKSICTDHEIYLSFIVALSDGRHVCCCDEVAQSIMNFQKPC